MPEVSVIVPVHNAVHYLPQCLDSIRAQTFSDIEIICIDDGSTDGSGDLLREYAASDDRIMVIHQENQGVSVARNSGLSAAGGEYIQFLDADDFFEPTLIEDVYTRCVEDDADMGIFPIRYFYEDTGVTVDAAWSLRMDLLPAKLPFDVTDMTGRIFRFVTPGVWNKMLRRSFVVEYGLGFSPDLKRAEDLPFAFRALVTARRITVVDKHLVNYRKHSRGSLQETIHEAPLEICRSLQLLKGQLVEAGLFEGVERDFVNAALHQFVFTLNTLRTAEAFAELYEALKNRYFEELRIWGRPRGYFYAEHEFDIYLRIRTVSRSEYLLEQTSAARTALEEVRGRRADVGSQLERTRKELKRIQQSRSYKIGRGIADLSSSRRSLSRDSRVEA